MSNERRLLTSGCWLSFLCLSSGGVASVRLKPQGGDRIPRLADTGQAWPGPCYPCCKNPASPLNFSSRAWGHRHAAKTIFVSLLGIFIGAQTSPARQERLTRVTPPPTVRTPPSPALSINVGSIDLLMLYSFFPGKKQENSVNCSCCLAVGREERMLLSLALHLPASTQCFFHE